MKNNIFDFHIADTIGNLVAVPSATCLFIAISKKKMDIRDRVSRVVFAFCVYECFGLIFDWYDIIATIISGIITYLVLRSKDVNCNE